MTRPRSVRTWLALFFVFLSVNTLMLFAARAVARAVFASPSRMAGEFEGLVLLAAFVVSLIQFPAMPITAVFDGSGWFGTALGLVILSAASATFYLCLGSWFRHCSRYRGERLWAEYRRGL